MKPFSLQPKIKTTGKCKCSNIMEEFAIWSDF